MEVSIQEQEQMVAMDSVPLEDNEAEQVPEYSTGLFTGKPEERYAPGHAAVQIRVKVLCSPRLYTHESFTFYVKAGSVMEGAKFVPACLRVATDAVKGQIIKTWVEAHGPLLPSEVQVALDSKKINPATIESINDAGETVILLD